MNIKAYFIICCCIFLQSQLPNSSKKQWLYSSSLMVPTLMIFCNCLGIYLVHDYDRTMQLETKSCDYDKINKITKLCFFPEIKHGVALFICTVSSQFSV